MLSVSFACKNAFSAAKTSWVLRDGASRAMNWSIVEGQSYPMLKSTFLVGSANFVFLQALRDMYIDFK